MSKSADLHSRRQDLGVALRELRESTSLSGSRLAARLGVSQSKVSKIETGLCRPSIDEVESMLTVLQASPETRERILAMAQIGPLVFTHARAMRQAGLDRNQQTVGVRERSAQEYRSYFPAAIAGLLQTPEYIRAMFSLPNSGGVDPQRMIAARLERQRVLFEGARSFQFLVGEAALRNRVGPSAVMATQMDHLVSASRLASVKMGILPWTIRLPQAPLHNFVIFDERLVVIETMHGDLKARDRTDILLYVELFESLNQVALHGEEAREFLLKVADEHRELPD
ncbi:transcriptional regulator [Longispora fulva]|uniref:Transcriptional regulator with XRE-family HTH domain n=1 Tax=Longispora fulva TaxID=619741 RepID=A0A8J7GWM5_9ACTN|nr:helix-turn-helix transcriptional regulator [Longispora fulva]MBG6139141.1 transcriptional regulator with XRE-family HTH domain [Longispora fulva]GIG58633.1 transcriptional regulator [Longispora fulva]